MGFEVLEWCRFLDGRGGLERWRGLPRVVKKGVGALDVAGDICGVSGDMCAGSPTLVESSCVAFSGPMGPILVAHCMRCLRRRVGVTRWHLLPVLGGVGLLDVTGDISRVSGDMCSGPATVVKSSLLALIAPMGAILGGRFYGAGDSGDYISFKSWDQPSSSSTRMMEFSSSYPFGDATSHESNRDWGIRSGRSASVWCGSIVLRGDVVGHEVSAHMVVPPNYFGEMGFKQADTRTIDSFEVVLQ